MRTQNAIRTIDSNKCISFPLQSLKSGSRERDGRRQPEKEEGERKSERMRGIEGG